MYLKRPFQLGSLILPSNVFCAPLAGCTDFPFRQTLVPYRPGLIFCEMVKMDAICHGNPKTMTLLDYESAMHPIGAQLVGSNPHIAGECAKLIEEMGFDLIDFNCGCPVDKITKDGSGSAMLKNPTLIGEIVSKMVSEVKIPVTVKIRIGWDENNIAALEITKIVEAAGAKALIIHGRFREDNYSAPINYDVIRECKERAKKMLIVGNGNIFDPLSAQEMFQKTGCDAILLSRGLLGQPWLIDDIYRHFEGRPPREFLATDLRDAFLDHFDKIIAYNPEKKAVLDLRRIGCWFLRHHRHTAELRDALNQTQSTAEIRTMVENFDWK